MGKIMWVYFIFFLILSTEDNGAKFTLFLELYPNTPKMHSDHMKPSNFEFLEVKPNFLLQ